MSGDFNLDAFLNKAEEKVNPGLSDNVSISGDPGAGGFPDVDKEAYVAGTPQEKEPEKDTDDYEFMGEKVPVEELEEALEVLTDPGYERQILRFYARLVEYNKTLCDPIIKRDQLTINSIGMLHNPIEIFINRKMIQVMNKQTKVLERIETLLRDKNNETTVHKD